MFEPIAGPKYYTWFYLVENVLLQNIFAVSITKLFEKNMSII